MTGDLVAQDAQVHAEARAVLDFWFALSAEQQFAKDPALDREIADRFGSLRDRVKASGAAGWRDHPDTLLAAIVLLDQVSRNLHRGSGEAYAADDLAVAMTLEAIGKDWDTRYPPERRAFLYMPLMHAEDVPLQDLSLVKFTALGNANNLGYARAHRDVILRYGRFPSRNAAIGRASTPEELDYLSRPDAGW